MIEEGTADGKKVFKVDLGDTPDEVIKELIVEMRQEMLSRSLDNTTEKEKL